MSLRRIASAVSGPVGIALLAGSLAMALRLPFVHDAPSPDEGGLLVVAARWHAGGPFLYGPLFVDRPPVLLLFFRLADQLGGLSALRFLGLVGVGASVLLAARAGALLGGPRGSVAAALTCAALLADPRLGTREIDAETVGVPLVLLAALLALEAVRRHPSVGRIALLVGAGIAGSAALLVKQNLADGLLFAIVLAAGGRVPVGRRHIAQVGWSLLGALLPLAAGVAWSLTATGLRGLWYALYGFRIAGATSLFVAETERQTARLDGLATAALVSGMVVLIVVALSVVLRWPGPDVTGVALLAMLAIELIGLAGGGSYWSHYLIAVVPATCLLVARAVSLVNRAWWLGLVVLVSLASTVTEVAVLSAHPTAFDRTEVGALTRWLDRADHPGESAVVLYGEASVFETTQLRPAYPFLWTLPQRVLDPGLPRLVRTLGGKRGPTFVVVRLPLDSWGQDPHGRVSRALARDYRPAAHIDGDVVYVRRGDLAQNAP